MSSYLQKHKIKWGHKTDPTLSYFVDKKGNKIARVIQNKFVLGLGDGFFWYGWFTRVDRLALLLRKLHEDAKTYSDTVLKPTCKKYIGDPPADGREKSVKVAYGFSQDQFMNWSNENYRDIGFVELAYHNDSHNDTKWISTNIQYLDGFLRWLNCSSLAELLQVKKWDEGIIFPENPEEGNFLRQVVEISRQKWQRYWRVNGFFEAIINKKLSKIEENYEVGAVIEFSILGEIFRYERLPPARYAKDMSRYGWSKISPKKIIEIDISDIVPKYPY
jgi:hypothetical protein